MAVYVEKKHWWLRNKKIVDKYMKEAKNLIASQDPNDVESALNLLDSALSVSPRYELALELKARSLLYLRRFKDVADMLHDYIPSLKFSGEDSGIGSSESFRESVSLLNELPSHGGESGDSSFKCFSVSDLKKKTRAALLESVRCFPDSLHDLEHLKLLYNSILRDRKLPGPVWKRHNVRYREIPGKLCVLTSRIQQLKERIANGGIGNVDYYALMGVRRDCSRSELDRAYLLLNLKHKPERSMSFIDRFELTEDEEEMDSVKDRARMSTLLLYRLIQKGYSVVTSDLATAEKQRAGAETPIRAGAVAANNNVNVVKGVFCRDLTVVGSLIARTGFNQPIPVKYEALSC
ncbi:hypothetical protein F2Q68_00018599 [Brassica cretica]|uniref:J domain-containing protein n=1 Tax=Brassica cretica TaxID=69181 RepID=A0A8S9FXN8_BRACR|nr:hypothetical protein F2Q68_00018599 [Brassica cretica]